jgi:hypothetical protein
MPAQAPKPKADSDPQGVYKRAEIHPVGRDWKSLKARSAETVSA